jgi:ADP-dependent NAD(P)H-hydrate dehydratase / NAD(P)H-hydrate epimerase
MHIEDMRTLEENAEFLGVPRIELMENAGKASYEILKGRLKGKKILFVCFHGNNGGDGFVLARHLTANNYDVKVHFIGDEQRLSHEAKINYNRIKKNLFARPVSYNGYDVIVDAILGTGAKQQLSQQIIDAVQMINNAKAFKVSLDMPTGLDPATGKNLGAVVNADLVIAFHQGKKGLKRFRKTVNVVDIGIPKEAYNYANDFPVLKRSKFSHKGDNGRIVIFGGDMYSGAAILAGLAAYRAGADLVHVLTSRQSAAEINSYSPDIIAKQYEPVKDRHLIEMADVILVGNGMSDKSLLIRQLLKLDKLKVVDAAAIRHVNLHKIRNSLITPHAAEMRLLLQQNKMELSDLRRNLSNNVILAKGHVDRVMSMDRFAMNKTGNAAMTVGGTGDVLAGLAAGILAQSKDIFRSAGMAACINGNIGDQLFRKIGNGIIASDFIDCIASEMENYQ